MPNFQVTLAGGCAQRSGKRFLAQIAQFALEAACETRYEDLCWPEKRFVAEKSRTAKKLPPEAKNCAERFSRELATRRAENCALAFDTPATYI